MCTLERADGPIGHPAKIPIVTSRPEVVSEPQENLLQSANVITTTATTELKIGSRRRGGRRRWRFRGRGRSLQKRSRLREPLCNVRRQPKPRGSLCGLSELRWRCSVHPHVA